MDFDRNDLQVVNYVDINTDQADVLGLMVGKTINMEKKLNQLESEVQNSTQTSRECSVRADFLDRMTVNVIEQRIPRLEEKVSASENKLSRTNEGCIHLDTRLSNVESKVSQMDQNQFTLARDGSTNPVLGNINQQITELRQRFDDFRAEVFKKAEVNAKEIAKLNERISQSASHINANTKNIGLINQKLQSICVNQKNSNMGNLKDLLSGCDKRAKSPIMSSNRG